MRKKLVFATFVLIGLLAFACNGSSERIEAVTLAAPQYSILGIWDYALVAEHEGSSYEYDSGTLAFEGTEAGGTFTLINFYEIEYKGAYTVDGKDVAITGSQIWTGAFTDATNMTGTWNSVEGEESGTWTATRQ